LNFKKLGLLSNLRRARSPAESRCFGPEAIQRSASPIIVEGVQRDFARSAAGRPDIGHHVQIGIEPALEPSTLPTRTRPSMVRRPVPLIGAVSDNPDPGPEPAGSREAADPCLEPSTRAHSSAPTRNALRRPLPSLGVPLRFSFGCPPVGLATFLQCAPSGSPCGSPSGLRRASLATKRAPSLPW